MKKTLLFGIVVLLMISFVSAHNEFALNVTDFYSQVGLNASVDISQSTFSKSYSTTNGLLLIPFDLDASVSRWKLDDVDFDYTKEYDVSEYSLGWAVSASCTGTCSTGALLDQNWETFTSSGDNARTITLSFKTWVIPSRLYVRASTFDGINLRYVSVPLNKAVCALPSDEIFKIREVNGAEFTSGSIFECLDESENWVQFGSITADTMRLYGIEAFANTQNPIIVADTNNLNNGTLYGKTFNHGTVSGGVTIEDGAMVFDGVDGVVTSGNDLITDFSTTHYSFEFWFKAPLETADSASAASLFRSHPVTTQRPWLNLNLRTSNIIFTYDRLSGDGGGLSVITSQNPDELVHIVATYEADYDGSGSGRYRLYKDGVLVDTDTQTNIEDLHPDSKKFQIGNPSNSIDAEIYVSRLYKGKLLEQGDVTKLFEAGKDSYSPISDGLVAQYSGRDFAGTTSAPTTIYDTNHLSAPPVAWLNASMNFDGVDDYVSLGNINNEFFTNNDGFSISLWKNTVSGQPSNTRILDKSGGTDARNGFFLAQLSDNRLQLRFDANPTVNSNSVFNTDVWEFVTINVQNNDITFYRNAISAGSGTSNFNFTTENPMYIGSFGGSSRYLNGQIADVRIYDRALSELEIQSIYTNSDLYNITVNAEDYYPKSIQNHNLNTNLTAKLYPFGAFNLSIRDINTNQLITENITILVENSNAQQTYNTVTGSQLIENLQINQNYQIKLQAQGYDTSFNSFTYAGFIENLTYYMNQNGTQISIRVQDVSGVRLSNANVIIQTYVDGKLVNAQSKFSDVNGLATFIIDTTKTNLVTINKVGYQSLNNLLIDFADTNIIVTLDSDERQITPTAFDGITWSLTPFNFALDSAQLQNFTFSISATQSNLDQFSLSLYNGTTLISFTASQVASGGTVSISGVNVSQYQNIRAVGAFTVTDFPQQQIIRNFFITAIQNYDGSLLELRQRMKTELTEFQRLIIFALTFFVIMIVLSVFITGFVNVLMSLTLSVLMAWIIGMNMFFLVSIASILMIILFAQTQER